MNSVCAVGLLSAALAFGAVPLKTMKFSDLKFASVRKKISDKEIPKLDCAKPEELKLVVHRDRTIWKKENGGTVLSVPVTLQNLSERALKLCVTRYSHTPIVPLVIVQMHQDKELREGVGHGSGFGPSYYPDPEKDTVEYLTYEFPAKAQIELEGISRDLNQYYKVGSPSTVEVRVTTSIQPGLKETFQWKWVKPN